MPESINSKLKEQYDHDDSGGSLDTNLGDFLDSEGASGTSNNSKWRDWASGTGTSLNTRLFHKHGGSGSFMTRWKNWIAFSSTHSFNFDGSNDYLEIADNDDLSFGDGSSDSPFSISAWINPVDSTQFQILGKLNEWQLYLGSDDKLILFLQGATGSDYEYASDSGSAISQNVWTHVACTYNGVGGTSANAGIKLYVNGVESSLTLGGAGTYDAMENTTNPVRIGNYSSQYADGKIDEVALWDVALSSSDITSIYNNGKVTDLSKSASYGTDRTDNLKLWLRCGDKAEPESTTAIARQDFYTDFDGTDDYVVVADNDDLSFGDGSSDTPFSISAWVNMVDATFFHIATKGIYNSNAEWVFETDSADRLRLGLFDESVNSTYEIAVATAMTSYQNEWVHVCATYDGRGGTDALNGIKIYYNGISQSMTGSFDQGTYVAMENLGADVHIGRYNTAYADGKISNLAIHQTALDAQTISQMAKSRFTPMRDNRFSVVDFDGVNDFIDIPDNDALDAGSGDMTITFWYNPLSMSANMEIIDKYDTSSNKGYRVRHHNGTSKVFFNINDGADTDGYYSYIDVALSYGQWYHVTIIWDNSEQQATYYINGVNYDRLASTSLRAIGDTSNSVPLRFGGTQAGGSDYKGSISSVAIYNVARTSEEDYACYQKGITHNPSADTGLVGLWRMGDDTSASYPTIADSSSNSNDGTMTNMASDDIVQQMSAGWDLGSFESSSEELNGEVISGSDWTPDSGITISNGSLIFNTSTQFNKAIDTTAVSGKFYKTVFTISNYVSGSVKIRIGAFGEERSGNGTYTEYITSTTGNVEFYAYTDGSNDFTIENISVKEVLQSEVSDTHPAIIDVNEPVLGVDQITNGTFDSDANWTKGTGWDIENGVAVCDGTQTGNTGLIQQSTILGANLDFEVGKTYKLTFDVTTTAGAISYIEIGGTTDHTDVPATASTVTRYIQASSTNDRLTIAGNSSYIGTVDNVVVKEVSGNVGTMTNQDSADLVYSSVLPDQSFLTGVNSAYNFVSLDGANDYVNTGSPFQSTFRDSFSVSAWIKPTDGIPPTDNNIFGVRGSGGRLYFHIDTSGYLRVYLQTNTVVYAIPNSVTFSNGQEDWHHVCAVINNSSNQISLYLNSSELTLDPSYDGDISALTLSNFTSTDNVYIGARNNQGTADRFFNGDMGQTAFWSKALSSIEVSAIYTLGRHGNLLDSYSDNLIGYWAMGALDAKTGLSDTTTTIYDRSGNSNHGTPVSIASSDLKSSPNAEPNGYAKGDTNRSTTTP